MSDSTSIARELEELEHAFMDAVRRRDLAYLERVLGDEFTLTTGRPGAEVRERQEWLDVTRDCYVIDRFEFEQFAAQVYGDVAVVRSRYRQVAHMGERERTGAYRMTDVWVRRAGCWQLASRHLTAVAES